MSFHGLIFKYDCSFATEVFYSFVPFVCVVSDYLSINILLHIIMHYVMLKSTCTLLYAVSAI